MIEPFFNANEARRRSDQALLKNPMFLAAFETINKSIDLGHCETVPVKLSDHAKEWFKAHNYKVLDSANEPGKNVISWKHAAAPVAKDTGSTNSGTDATPQLTRPPLALFGSSGRPPADLIGAHTNGGLGQKRPQTRGRDSEEPDPKRSKSSNAVVVAGQVGDNYDFGGDPYIGGDDLDSAPAR